MDKHTYKHLLVFQHHLCRSFTVAVGVTVNVFFPSDAHTHANTDSQDENGNGHIVVACNDTSSAIMTVN